MNFEGLNPSLAEYAPPLHPALDPVLDAHLNPSLVELDPEGVSLEGMAVPDQVHLMEGMYSELHTAVSEVGVPVSVSHFDLHEEMLWVGNHGVRARGAPGGAGFRGIVGWEGEGSSSGSAHVPLAQVAPSELALGVLWEVLSSTSPRSQGGISSQCPI